MYTLGIYSRCYTYKETELFFCTTKLCEKQRWKSDILSENVG